MLYNPDNPGNSTGTMASASKIVKSFLAKAGFQIQRTGDPLRLKIYNDIYSQADLDSRNFLNVGGNNFDHPYWRNLDIPSQNYSGTQSKIINYDLNSLKPLPVPDNSICIVYTSHTIEHVPEKSVANLFKESHRALKPGGIFRVTTGPDADLDYRALEANDKHWFYWDDWHSKNFDNRKQFLAPNSVPLAERWLAHVATQLAPNEKRESVKYGEKEILTILEQKGLYQSLDFFTSQCQWDAAWTGSHVSWWNSEKIIQFMRDAGFKVIYKSGYHQSISPVMRNTPLFDSTHPSMSVYVEAIKEAS